jgi:hypothetical protein
MGWCALVSRQRRRSRNVARTDLPFSAQNQSFVIKKSIFCRHKLPARELPQMLRRYPFVLICIAGFGRNNPPSSEY